MIYLVLPTVSVTQYQQGSVCRCWNRSWQIHQARAISAVCQRTPTMAAAWTSGLLVSLIIFTPLWFISSRYLRRPARMRSVVVFVLGDVGRSPRMMYHAESFANNGFETYIVGYRGTHSKVPSVLPDFDIVNYRLKANSRSIVNPSCPIFLPRSTPSVLLPSPFYDCRPHKDNTSSFSHPYYPPVHNPQHI